jgi:hypothetical protein
MTSSDNFNRLFSPSAFEAARIIRRFRRDHANVSDTELLPIVRALVPDGLDYESGRQLEETLSTEVDTADPSNFYRHCIGCLVHTNPVWVKIITLGRHKFVQKLSRDEQNCFQFAGLLVEPPTSEIIAWWDQTVGKLRKIAEFEVMERARKAELLSLERERTRLRGLGIPLEPKWVGFDDNTVGYDILSYDLGEQNPINRLIEVKSTIASPLRFILSRGEWEAALKFRPRYFFHIWDLRSEQLYERTVEDVQNQIPSDNTDGRWKQAIIPI